MDTLLRPYWSIAFAIAGALASPGGVHGYTAASHLSSDRETMAIEVVERWRLDGHCSIVAADAAGTGVQCDGVWIAPVLLTAVDELLLASPSFRQQFAVVRGHGLQVKVASSQQCRAGARACDGATTISRYAGGRTLAIVRLRSGGPIIRMLGHEFEHLREWCEGALRLGAIGHPGQPSETARAVEAGERVEKEHAAWLKSL